MTTVLITGANRGLGLALTRAWLSRGDVVVATCRRPDVASDLTGLAPAHDGRLVILRLDVTDETAVDGLATEVGRHAPALDVLVNNAGVLRPAHGVADLRADDMAHTFAVNTIAPLLVARAVLPLLRLGSGPRIVNITMPSRSIGDIDASADQPSFRASRYAHNVLTRMLALDVGAEGIVTVGLYPGLLQTDMSRQTGLFDDGTPPDVAAPGLVDLIARLTAEHNGQCLMPDGSIFPW